MKKISICIPAFNDWEELARTLISFGNLPFERNGRVVEFEILISDNHSTDETREMLARWDFQGLPVSVYRQETNLGFRGNLEFLSLRASGEWLLFMSCGDEIGLKFNLVDLVNHLAASPESTVFFGFELFDHATSRQIVSSNQEQAWTASQSEVLFSPAPMPIFRRKALLDAISATKSISGNWWPQVEWALHANKQTQAASLLGHLDIKSHRPEIGWWVRSNAYQSVIYLYKTLRFYQNVYSNPELLSVHAAKTMASLPAWVFQTKVVHGNRLGLKDLTIVLAEYTSAPFPVSLAVALILCPRWILNLARKLVKRLKSRR